MTTFDFPVSQVMMDMEQTERHVIDSETFANYNIVLERARSECTREPGAGDES